MNEELLTVKEFARRAGMSPQAVYKAIKAGRLQPAKRDGKRVFLLSTEINRIRPWQTINNEKETLDNLNPPKQTKNNQPKTTGGAGEGQPPASDEGIEEPVQEEKTEAAALHKLIDMLQQQLETKDKQIIALTEALTEAQLSIRAAQALHAGTIKTQLIEDSGEIQEEEEKEVPPAAEKKGFFRRLFGK